MRVKGAAALPSLLNYIILCAGSTMIIPASTMICRFLRSRAYTGDNPGKSYRSRV